MVPPSGSPPSWRGGYEALTPQLHPSVPKGVTHSAREVGGEGNHKHSGKLFCRRGNWQPWSGENGNTEPEKEKAKWNEAL